MPRVSLTAKTRVPGMRLSTAAVTINTTAVYLRVLWYQLAAGATFPSDLRYTLSPAIFHTGIYTRAALFSLHRYQYTGTTLPVYWY